MCSLGCYFRNSRAYWPNHSAGQGRPEIDTRLRAYMFPYDPNGRETEGPTTAPFYSRDPDAGPVFSDPAGDPRGGCMSRPAAATRISADSVPANTHRGGDIRVTLSPKTVGCTSGLGGLLW